MNTENSKNTIYNKFNSIVQTKTSYRYLIHCANIECEKLIDIKKCIWESQLDIDFPKIFSCSKECMQSECVKKLQIQKRLNKFGYINVFQSEEVKKKIKITILEKYGAENIAQTVYFKRKSKDTFLKNYGVDNPNKCPEIIEKSWKTRLNRYKYDLHGWAVKSKMFKTNIDRYGNKWYFASDRGKQTLENYIKNYGIEEGTLKWNARVESQKQTLENFIRRYGLEEGNFRYEYWKQSCIQTLENFIRRHGDILGIELYEQFTKKRLQNLLKNGRKTKLNNDFEEILLNYISIFNFIREFPIKDDKFYYYDFYIPEKNIIIEIHGDFWHCNPNKYISGQLISWPGKSNKVLVDDIWAKDINKEYICIKNNIKYYSFWEFDIRKNINLIHLKLEEILNND